MPKNQHRGTGFYQDTICKGGRLPARKRYFKAKIFNHTPKSG